MPSNRGVLFKRSHVFALGHLSNVGQNNQVKDSLRLMAINHLEKISPICWTSVKIDKSWMMEIFFFFLSGSSVNALIYTKVLDQILHFSTFHWSCFVPTCIEITNSFIMHISFGMNGMRVRTLVRLWLNLFYSEDYKEAFSYYHSLQDDPGRARISRAPGRWNREPCEQW